MRIDCAICLDFLSGASNTSVTPCGHIFHTVCLVEWLQRSTYCPQCRNGCTISNIHRVYINTTNDDINQLEKELEDARLKLRKKKNIIKKSSNNLISLRKDKRNLRDALINLITIASEKDMIINCYQKQNKAFKRYSKKHMTELKTNK